MDLYGLAINSWRKWILILIIMRAGPLLIHPVYGLNQTFSTANTSPPSSFYPQVIISIILLLWICGWVYYFLYLRKSFERFSQSMSESPQEIPIPPDIPLQPQPESFIKDSSPNFQDLNKNLKKNAIWLDVFNTFKFENIQKNISSDEQIVIKSEKGRNDSTKDNFNQIIQREQKPQKQDDLKKSHIQIPIQINTSIKSKISQTLNKKMGMVFLTLIVIIIIIPFLASMTAISSNNQSINQTPTKTTVPITVVTRVQKTAPTNPIPTTIPITVSNTGARNTGLIVFPYPEKIVKTEDLQPGDLIQMSANDSRYDKDHGFRIENIFPQTNEFHIKEIILFKTDNRWFTMGGDTGRLITSGALMRDYPYKFGQAPKPLPKKCLMCPKGPMTQCSKDDLIFTDC